MKKQSNKLTEDQKDYVRVNHSSISIRTMAYNLRVSPYYITSFMVEEKLSFKIKRKERKRKTDNTQKGYFDLKTNNNWLV